MDPVSLVQTLTATLSMDAAERTNAEARLNEVQRIINFVPTLLQIVMQNDIGAEVRQAAAVYLKNIITTSWLEKEVSVTQPLEFSIHELDRGLVRDSIVEALIQSPEMIRVQLGTCIYNIIKCDFPGRWPQIVDQIRSQLSFTNPQIVDQICNLLSYTDPQIVDQIRNLLSYTDPQIVDQIRNLLGYTDPQIVDQICNLLSYTDLKRWSGALLCLYQLVKNYEYKKADERTPLTEAMQTILPLVHGLMNRLLSMEHNEECVLLQKQVLKIFHAMTQYCLPLDLITNEVFSQWMHICCRVIESPVPDLSDKDEDERLEMPWWKVKKWAMHICCRTFDRYGSPGHVVNKEYQKFAEWYLPTFTENILKSLFNVLDQYRNNVYVSPRVITEILHYIKTSVTHAHTWKLIKPHMLNIIRYVIFPILQYTEADEELWEEDPKEYIRTKYDIYDDYSSSVPSAQELFFTSCKTRKGILKESMQFLMSIVVSPNVDPKQKDGALRMIGAVADILLRKQEYRDQMEPMLTTYIFPEFQSPHGHMRARACWVLCKFSEVKFKNQAVLVEALRLATQALLTDAELPVQVEAAIVLQEYLSTQKDADQLLKPQIREIALKLLQVIKETENDDLTNVMQKIVHTFSEELQESAENICNHLAETFMTVLASEEGADEQAVTAMGLLNTMETLLSVFEENPTIIARLQPIVIQVINHILTNNIVEFYEEAFSLVYDLTSNSISGDMWRMLGAIFECFQATGIDYFLDLMPALHNYITVDTSAFLANENHVLAIFEMCKMVLTQGDAGEDAECHAAKLIEVIILQCRGQIDNAIPSCVELVLGRLMKEVKSSELRTMCLQVLIAALYYNPALLIQTMNDLQTRLPQTGGEQLLSHFIRQWLDDTDCFLGIHDRKLYVLGLSTAISLREHKPAVLNELAEKILPSLLLIFDGLKRAYQARAQEGEEEEESGDEDDDEDCEEALSSDEDEANECDIDSIGYFATKKAHENGIEMSGEIKEDEDSDEDDDDDDDEFDETTLETYVTPIDDEKSENPIDEYITFCEVMKNMETQDPQYYAVLMSRLNAEQTKGLQNVLEIAGKKQAQYASQALERQGGYAFPQQTVPTTFNFGS